MQVFKDIYAYRELLKTNIKKDIRGKYKGSFLGVLWSFINPLLQVMVYAIVFPFIMGTRGVNTGDNYVVYLITGIIPWTLFITVVQQGTTCIKANAGIINKVYFPREILVISQACSALINFFISCLIILAFCLFYGIGISYHLILIPVLALVETILSLGVAFFLSAVNVYIQDIEYIIGFILNMGFYASPIVYRLEMFSSSSILYTLIQINPITMLIDCYRDVFVQHVFPPMQSIGIVFVVGIVFLLVGYAVFKKLEKGFAEEL